MLQWHSGFPVSVPWCYNSWYLFFPDFHPWVSFSLQLYSCEQSYSWRKGHGTHSLLWIHLLRNMFCSYVGASIFVSLCACVWVRESTFTCVLAHAFVGLHMHVWNTDVAKGSKLMNWVDFCLCDKIARRNQLHGGKGSFGPQFPEVSVHSQVFSLPWGCNKTDIFTDQAEWIIIA